MPAQRTFIHGPFPALYWVLAMLWSNSSSPRTVPSQSIVWVLAPQALWQGGRRVHAKPWADFQGHRDVRCHNNLRYLQLQAIKCSGASAGSSCPTNRLDLDANTDRHRSLFTGLHSQNSTEQETTHQDKLQRTFPYNRAPNALRHTRARGVFTLPCRQSAKWINPAKSAAS